MKWLWNTRRKLLQAKREWRKWKQTCLELEYRSQLDFEGAQKDRRSLSEAHDLLERARAEIQMLKARNAEQCIDLNELYPRLRKAEKDNRSHLQCEPDLRTLLHKAEMQRSEPAGVVSARLQDLQARLRSALASARQYRHLYRKEKEATHETPERPRSSA